MPKPTSNPGKGKGPNKDADSGDNLFTTVETADGMVVYGTSGDDFIDLSGATGALTATESTSGYTIYGLDGEDTIIGSAGDDVIYGGYHNDILDGWEGSDTYVDGSDGFDSIVDSGTSGWDVIVAAHDYDQIFFNSFDSSNGIEEISANGYTGVAVTGTNQDNVLDFSGTVLTDIDSIRAGAGNDTVIGSAGDDVIWGGMGDDTLTGGGGNDTIVYHGTSDGSDTITDWEDGADMLDFSYMGADSVSVTQSGADAVVTVSVGGDSLQVTLSNTDAATLDDADWIL